MPLNGILNINKPPDETSFALVKQTRRLANEKRVGHMGTLDPFAEGVLPIFLGKSTRIISYLEATAKKYQASIELGVTTDTFDKTGTIIKRRDPSKISFSQVTDSLTQFTGNINQIPPMYSAVHHNGKRLYEYARQGKVVERATREITIYGIDLLNWEANQISLEITCGKGTYVRTIAHDLGEVLGCGATIQTLIRTQNGPFVHQDTQTMEEVTQNFQTQQRTTTEAIDYPLQSLPALYTSEKGQKLIGDGRPISGTEILRLEQPSVKESLFWPSGKNNLARCYGPTNQFIATLQHEEDLWKPDKVLFSNSTT
jgi:tRNA pseudouridine55 synthase